MTMRIPKASEFFIAGISSCELTAHEHNFLSHNRLGGIILFKRNVENLEQVVKLNQSIINANAKPPIISVDQEGGRVARLRGIFTDVPPLLSLQNTFRADPHRAYRLGAMQARELAVCGFQLNFAPVCDVLIKDSEVIGDRAFSSNPEVAALLAAEYISGLQGAGVAGCAKHFPGHGATAVDSHLALPTLDTDEATLQKREFLPFRSAITANVATIMTAHIITKPLDTWPATLSEKTLTTILRGELGFHNVIISDDLSMKAVADNYSLREILERGIASGIDLFITGHDFAYAEEAIGILDHLIATHEPTRAKAILAAERIERLRARFMGSPAAPDLAMAKALVRSSPHLELVSSYR